jgi:hypothetical protein
MYVVGKHGNVLKFALVQYIIKVKTVALLEDIVVVRLSLINRIALRNKITHHSSIESLPYIFCSTCDCQHVHYKIVSRVPIHVKYMLGNSANSSSK